VKSRVRKIMIAAVIAAAASLQTNAATRSRSIVIESPSDLPKSASRNTEAMYLHETDGGQTLLYLEQDQGRSLSILDVSEPGAIQSLGQVSIAASSPYDFVQTLNDSSVAIRYRGQTGTAVIDFKKFKKPVLTEAPEFQHLAHAEHLGQDGLLFSTTATSDTQVVNPQYQVVDFSNSSKPVALATIEGVRQRLERTETGTLFLLSNAGLTVIRRPAAEKEYEMAHAARTGDD
jgi:hypothetical protein